MVPILNKPSVKWLLAEDAFDCCGWVKERDGPCEEQGLCSVSGLCSSPATAVGAAVWRAPAAAPDLCLDPLAAVGLCDRPAQLPQPGESHLYLAKLVTFLLAWLPATPQTEVPVCVLRDEFVVAYPVIDGWPETSGLVQMRGNPASRNDDCTEFYSRNNPGDRLLSLLFFCFPRHSQFC